MPGPEIIRKLIEFDQFSTFSYVYDVFGPKWHPQMNKKEWGKPIFGPGRSKSSPAGPACRPGVEVVPDGPNRPTRPAGPAEPA